MCRIWCDTGEVAVVLTVDDASDEPKDYFIGYFQDIGSATDLPFTDLMAYASSSLNANTIRLKLTVIDLDEFNQGNSKFVQYLQDLSPKINQTFPQFSPISDTLILNLVAISGDYKNSGWEITDSPSQIKYQTFLKKVRLY